jgi:hypothetical protein
LAPPKNIAGLRRSKHAYLGGYPVRGERDIITAFGKLMRFSLIFKRCTSANNKHGIVESKWNG